MNDPSATRAADTPPPACSELARILLMHAVSGIFQGCGNSYSNAYTEQWLAHAKSLGAYHGRVTGKIRELEEEWETWLEENGGLPDWPDIPNARPVRTDGPQRDSGTHEAVVGRGES